MFRLEMEAEFDWLLQKKKKSIFGNRPDDLFDEVFWSYLIQSSGKKPFENISKEKAEGDWANLTLSIMHKRISGLARG